MNGVPTAWGVAIQNITAQEKSWVRNVQITDIGGGGRGINIAATGQQIMRRILGFLPYPEQSGSNAPWTKAGSTVLPTLDGGMGINRRNKVLLAENLLPKWRSDPGYGFSLSTVCCSGKARLPTARKYYRFKESGAVTTRQPTTRQPRVHTQLGRAAVEIFVANDRMNQMLIEHLDPAAWSTRPTTAKPRGKNKVRTIAAIFTHMHNVRTKWVRLTAPHLKIPPQLNRARCTPQRARAGLAESAARCAEMLAEALGGGGGRVEKFRRDGWARPWPVGLEMLCYMLAHEAHHRGQVCMLAHQLGFPLPIKVTSGIWNWEKLWKECGSPGGIGGDS